MRRVHPLDKTDTLAVAMRYKIENSMERPYTLVMIGNRDLRETVVDATYGFAQAVAHSTLVELRIAHERRWPSR